MTAIASRLVDKFRRREPPEQRWVCNEILRLDPVPSPSSLTDDELTAIADQTFVLLDKEEADAKPR